MLTIILPWAFFFSQSNIVSEGEGSSQAELGRSSTRTDWKTNERSSRRGKYDEDAVVRTQPICQAAKSRFGVISGRGVAVVPALHLAPW